MNSKINLSTGNRIGYIRNPYIAPTLKENKDLEQNMLEVLHASKGTIQNVYREKSDNMNSFNEMCDDGLKRGDTLVITNLFVLGDNISEQIDRLKQLHIIGVDLEICDIDIDTKRDSQIEVLQKVLMNIESVLEVNKAPRKKGRPELQYPKNADDTFYLVLNGKLSDRQAMEQLQLKRDKYYDFKRMYKQKCNDTYFKSRIEKFE